MIKKLILSSVAVFSIAFGATYKAGVNFDVRAIGQIGGPTPLAGAQTFDTVKIEFTGSIDNVEAYIRFDGKGTVAFNRAYVKVNDLFSGLLTLQFYDWYYGALDTAKYDNAILPDYNFQGFYATVKPISLLEVGLGYGIQVAGKITDSRSVAIDGSTISVDNKDASGTHGIRAHIGIPNEIVPVTIYAGAIINSGGDLGGFGSDKYVAPTNNDSRTRVGDKVKEGRNNELVNQVNVGVDLDPLALFLPGWFKVYVGFTPGLGSATKAVTVKDGKLTEENELTIAAGLYGVLDFGAIGVMGLKVDHAWQYSSDTVTKRDVSVNDGAGGTELFSLYLKPHYQLGQFNFGLPFYFGIFGAKNSTYSSKASSFSEGYNSFSVGPEIKWTPASGVFITGFYEFKSVTSLEYSAGSADKIADWAKSTQKIGLKVGASFATSSEE